MDIFNIVGFIGTASYILGYLLLQIGKIEQGYTYILLNLFGAICLIFSLVEYWNAPSFLIQSIWVIISLVGLVVLFLNNKEFDSIYLVKNIENEPAYFALSKKDKIVKLYKYNSLDLFNNVSKISIKENTFISKELKVNLFQNQPPLRHEVSGTEDFVVVFDAKKDEIFRIRKKDI